MSNLIDSEVTEEITIDVVKSRSVKGIVLLTGRTFVLSAISLFATGLLTVFLDPSQFGVFWIVSAIVNFFAYFSDIGLAASLIQKKEKPNDEDLKTTFTIQQLLVLLILIGMFIGMPIFQRIYGLSMEGKYLLYALGISLVFSSLKTIPSVLLERELEFSKLVIPQVIETLVYSLVAVFFAWKGLGLRSFTYAVLIRGFVGLVLIYLYKPWMPGLYFSKKSFKKLLSYGLPYQANTLLAVLKDDAMIAFLGTILGASGMGFLGWAQRWGYAPLRFFMDHIVKVTFPAFARMQDKKQDLKHSLTRSIFFICFLVFPTLIGLLIVAPILVRVIPRYEKWLPAVIPLTFIGINTFFAATTTQLTNLLNSIGKIKVTFKLMIMWTVLTWVLVPILAIKYGVNGAAFGYSVVGFSSIIAIFIARQYVRFSLIDSAFKPALSAIVMGILLYLLRGYLPQNMKSVIILIVIGIVIYLSLSFVLIGQSLVTDIKKSVSTLLGKDN
ncbi:oligosaccharide flippase family protein [Patescibacteria group bacterium]|nr:oligosaccharide flippase family protein [Patescibacteria group bacterium]